MALRQQGDWEGWLRFFLIAAIETADEATKTAGEIVRLREEHRQLIQEHNLGNNALRLLDELFGFPILNVNLVGVRLGISFQTANKIVGQFASLGIIDQYTVGQRNRAFRYTPYMRLFAEPSVSDDQDIPSQVTETEA